jgi:hypothetical protein
MIIRTPKPILGLFVAIVLVATAQAEDFPRLDEAFPRGGNTERYAPVFDFRNDSCFPATPFSSFGRPNHGVGSGGVSRTSGCRHGAFLDYSNTLHRWACTEDDAGSNYCGHVYELYFEKDQVIWGSDTGGHKHDWELVTVWTKNGDITHVNVSQHGDRPTLPASSLLFYGPGGWGEGPISGEREHPMILYHLTVLGPIVTTHAFFFANSDYAQNPFGFVTPPLISWYHFRGSFYNTGASPPFPSVVPLTNDLFRYLINNHLVNSFGDAHMSVPDVAFLGELNSHLPCDEHACYPTFTNADVAAANPNHPVLTFVDGDGDLLGEDAEYVLDFGTVARGFGTLSAELAVGNDVAEAADWLDGDFDTTGAAPYVLDGFEAFAGLEVGESLEGLVVELATAGLGPGVVSREIEFQPRGLVDTGFREPSGPITLILTVDIVNQPPIAQAGPDQTVECTSPDGATVTLDGTGSFDPDGDPIVEYVWTDSFGTGSGPMPALPFPFGTETVSLVVSDDVGASSEPDTMQVTVQDTVAPEMALTARPAVLWPPNGKMVPVRIEADAMDTCDAAPVCMITDVSSSGGGQSRSDWQVEGDLSLELRAKRKGFGQAYAIGVECVDGAGNRSMGTTQVSVPHDRSKKK